MYTGQGFLFTFLFLLSSSILVFRLFNNEFWLVAFNDLEVIFGQADKCCIFVLNTK